MKQAAIRRIQLNAIAIAFLAAGLSGPATAELARQGPVVPANGYPEWFQDSTGLALGLCLPDAIDLEQGNCLLLPGDIPSAPETFPTNFFDEHFWFAAGSALTTGNAGKANLVLAVEAAFGGGVAKVGDQIAFGRIRVKITNLPSNGTYKVIHPYGELVFPDQVAGGIIFYTDDVGINCPPGDFSCALKTGVGPFLRASTFAGGPALDPVIINGKAMLADPVTPTFVTGGPFSNKFRIEGPDIGGPGINVLETDQFDLMGRIHTAPIPSPLRAERAGYTRNGSGAWIDVFASAAAGIGKPAPMLNLAGAGIVPKGMLPDGKGTFWGQTNVTSAAVPSAVKVTNSSDVPPTTVDVTVTDAVTITEVLYDPQSKKMTVKARSSDEGNNPPSLYLPDYNGASCDNVLGATIDNIMVPPKEIIVRSSAGGSATAPVVTKQAAPIALTLADATQSGDEDTLMAFSVAPTSGGGFTAGSFRVLAQPAHGVVTIDANGNASYMPAKDFEGGDSFTFVVADSSGNDTNIATATLTVTPVNDPPTAKAIQTSTTGTLPVSINLLANASDPDLTTGVDPASFQITPVGVTSGSFSIVNGVATYTPAGAGTFNYTYQVADKGSPALTATAALSVTVIGTENLVVSAAEYRSDKARWKVSGTTDVDVDQVITIRLANVTATGTTLGPVLGTAVVGAAGAWALDTVGSSVPPTGYNRVHASSPLGGSGLSTFRAR